MNLNLLRKGNSRTAIVKRNIIGLSILKGVNVLISLQIVPMTINYINPEKYGIWLTLSSIIAWIGYFDFGFANGFRNRFAEAKAKGNIRLAKEYVSTTYAVLFILFSILCIIINFANSFIDWSNLLKVNSMYKEELQLVFGYMTCFFCINIVAQVFTIMLHAELKSVFATLIQTIGNALALLFIYILTKYTNGSLVLLSVSFMGIPCFFLIIVSIITFSRKEYRCVAPSVSYIRFSLTRRIIGLGGQFFIIMLSMLFIYQFVNIIISREQGSIAVTQYNIAYKYFNVLTMVVMIVMTPFWSAVTDAYTKKDFIWIKNVVRKLERMCLLCIPILIIMILCADFFYGWWIGGNVNVPKSLSICVALYMLFQACGNVYMYIINGIGKIRLQMIVYVIFALISIPFIQLGCKKWGIEGALIIPIVVYIAQAIIGRIQLYKIIGGKANGIWFK